MSSDVKILDRLTKMLSMSLIVAILLLSIFFVGCNNQKAPSSMVKSFDETLKVHLNAIKNGNLAELDPTVADSVILISPDGYIMKAKKSFMALHEQWFKQNYWQWEGKYVRTVSTDSLGYALIQYKYSQKDSIGTIVIQNENYLLLIFKNSTKGWQLIHDQNTGVTGLPKQ